ncbi:hypothetical protein BD560DRAFT_386861 [Blakeslea trispora]|nr:hypothetical protein BD560DRAFT_386861 [Blakeslea trispora]
MYQHQQINDPYQPNRISPFADPPYTPSEQSAPSYAGSINNYNHSQDHYSSKKNSPLQQQPYRTNAYQNPNYLSPDQELPSFNAPQQQQYHHSLKHTGPNVQDNFIVDDVEQVPYYPQEIENQNKQKIVDSLPDEKKPWWAPLSLHARSMVFCLFGFILLVGIIWYFVWPREPTLFFLEAGLAPDTTAQYSKTTMEAVWSVNFTVNNMNNWVPTNIQNFAVSVIEVYSGEVFGKGNSGHLVLRPRSLDQIVQVPIFINLTRDATNPTLRTLLGSCWVTQQDTNTPIVKESLNIKFSVIYYIAGIVWHTTSVFAPQSYFICP